MISPKVAETVADGNLHKIFTSSFYVATVKINTMPPNKIFEDLWAERKALIDSVPGPGFSSDLIVELLAGKSRSSKHHVDVDSNILSTKSTAAARQA